MQFLVFSFCVLVFNHPKMLVRVYDSPVGLINQPHTRGLDIAGVRPGEWVDVVVTQEELSRLSIKNFKVLVPDIEELQGSLRGYYHYYPEFVDSFTQIALNHPDIARLDTIGVSWEGRAILGMKISDNVGIDEDEPELLFTGLHHAREWPTLETCLFYADTLTRGYSGDAHITNIVNSREIWLVPCVNPDGYVYCHDEGNDWRKNRRYFPEFGTYGVDLNRNYPGSCNADPWGEWGGVFGGATSHGPDDQVYCGPAPFSEYEVQAIKDLILAHNFTFSVSYHTRGEMVLWPWGYTETGTPDSILLQEVGEAMASRIERQIVGTYDAFQAYGLYPTIGNSDDWVYGHSLFVQGKNTLAYTIEQCYEFAPAPTELDQVVRENFDGAIYLCDIADSIRNLMVPRIIPPAPVELDTVLKDYEISWQKSPAAAYALEELTGFSAVRDSAESVSDLWVLQGFTRSTARPHSGAYSYFGGESDNTVSAMTTRYPLPRTDSLIFWTWYKIDLEYSYDYAFVEFSLIGRDWQILDAFNGSSGGWQRKAYPLPPCKSLFVRFRYVTDSWILGEGFYVDDIYPVANFDSTIIVSDSIIDTFYLVSNKPAGTYWYRVAGHNLRGWGDFSELEDVVVQEVGIEARDRWIEPFIRVASSNPFGREIAIEYSIPVEQSGSLKIYDIAGRLVHAFNHLPGFLAGRGLTNYQSPFNRVVWDAQGVSSGVYFVVLRAEDYKKSVKVTLIK